jgi:MFS family permease
MAWIAGYTAHTLELSALRAWGVTFLAAAIVLHGAPAWLPGPNLLFTVAGLVGVAISVAGNETAQRLGRARMVAWAMGAGAVLSVAAGFSLLVSAPLAALCVLVLNAAIYLDSAALTAGTVAAAERERRGATMGLHSMCGYAGGFVGPVAVGMALDFGQIALVTLAGLWAVRRLGRATP